jgi:hypothetical protein
MSEKSRHKSVPTQEKRVPGIGMSEQKLVTYSHVADMSPTFPAKTSPSSRLVRTTKRMPALQSQLLFPTTRLLNRVGRLPTNALPLPPAIRLRK